MLLVVVLSAARPVLPNKLHEVHIVLVVKKRLVGCKFWLKRYEPSVNSTKKIKNKQNQEYNCIAIFIHWSVLLLMILLNIRGPNNQKRKLSLSCRSPRNKLPKKKIISLSTDLKQYQHQRLLFIMDIK